MKSIYTVIFMILSFSGLCQNYKDLKGRIYRDKSELVEFNNLSGCAYKADSFGNICRIYSDTLTDKPIYIIEQEIKTDTTYVNIIKDVLVVDTKLDKNNVFILGTNQIANENNKYSFVIAIESYNTFEEAVFYLNKTGKILAAWTYNVSKSRIEKLKIKGLYRVHEGYYRK